MTVDDVDGLSPRDVPHEDEVIVAGAQEDVFGRRVPLETHHAASMALQLDQEVGEVGGREPQTAIGNVPQLYGAVLGGAGDDVVVERVPFDVQHGSTVTANFSGRVIDATDFVERHDEETSASADFDDDGQELWIDGAKVSVVGVPRDANIFVALLSFDRRAEHVPEL